MSTHPAEISDEEANIELVDDYAGTPLYYGDEADGEHPGRPRRATYEHALLTATRIDDETREASGALFTSNGDLVRESPRSLDATDVWTVVNPDRVSRTTEIVGKHNVDGVDFYLDEGILGGHLLAGWGHLITETISTAWAAEQLPDAPLILIPWGRAWVSGFPRIMETLRLAGWDRRNVIVATGEMIFGKAHVPERLINLGALMDEGAEINPSMNTVYDRMIARSGGVGGDKKIFLPRPEAHRRAHPHEADVEQALIAEGYTSIRGWDLPVADQIAAVNEASHLVGFSGSNLHNSVFAQRGIPVVELMDARAQEYAEQSFTRLQEPLCKLREQPFTEVSGFREGQPRTVTDMVADVKVAAG